MKWIKHIRSSSTCSSRFWTTLRSHWRPANGIYLPTLEAKMLAKALVLVAAIATMDRWFPRIEEIMLAVAEYVNPGYNESSDSTASTIRESITTNPEGQEWSWRRLNESIYQAVSNALANIFASSQLVDVLLMFLAPAPVPPKNFGQTNIVMPSIIPTLNCFHTTKAGTGFIPAPCA